MNVLLTDHLACARCGPDFSLVLLAQDVKDRRALSGELGCPNCRDRYPVTAGFADLRAPPRTLHSGPGTQSLEASSPLDPLDPLELAACLAVPEGPGYFVFIGALGAYASQVAALVRDMEVVVVDPAAASWAEEVGVTRMAAGPGLPFRGGARGVALGLGDWARWGTEAQRVAAFGARVVIAGVGEGLTDRPAAPGFARVLDEGGFLVFAKKRGVLSGFQNPVA